MKVKSLVLSTVAAVIMPVAGLTVPALASSPGQIDGGDIYRVKNITQNSAYAGTATANKCEELQYKVLLHNSGFGSVTNVTASATLPSAAGTSNKSDMNVTYQSTGPENSVSGSVTVNLTSSQTISYENGTSQVLDSNNQVIKNLPDGITSGGVNIGSIPGSTAEFVTFKAKVNCPTPPSCKTTPSLCPPSTPPKTPPSTPPAQTPPTTLVNTGPGDVIGIFSAVTIAGALGYRLYLSRRLARQ